MEVKGIDLLNAMKAAHKEPPKTARAAEVKPDEKTSEPKASTQPVAESAPQCVMTQGELDL